MGLLRHLSGRVFVLSLAACIFCAFAMLVRADEGQTPAQGVSGSFFASFRNLERTWLGHLASGPTTPSAPSFAAPAGSGVATGSLASSEGGTDPYFSGSVRPALPRLFRLKARVWHHNAAEPVMMVVHYDGPRKRTREDWFTLVDSFHKRFVTDIKDFKIGLKHWIFHKQPRVPRMCLMAPVLEPFVGPTTVSSAALVGTDAGVFFAASNATRRCEHWRFRHAGAQVEACLSRDPLPQPPAAPGAAAGAPAVEGLGLGLWRPLMIQHPLARIEILEFEPLRAPPPHWEAVFDAQRASKARCTAWD